MQVVTTLEELTLVGLIVAVMPRLLFASGVGRDTRPDVLFIMADEHWNDWAVPRRPFMAAVFLPHRNRQAVLESIGAEST